MQPGNRIFDDLSKLIIVVHHSIEVSQGTTNLVMLEAAYENRTVQGVSRY